MIYNFFVKLYRGIVSDGLARFVGRPLIDLVLETHQPMDTVITLANGKLGAHRLVLSAASPFLRDLLLEQVSWQRSRIPG